MREEAHGVTLGGSVSVLSDGLTDAALGGAPAMLAYWDADCRNVIANAAYARWTGISVQQLRGLHLHEVLGEAVYRWKTPYIDGVLRGVPQVFDRLHTDVGGTTRHAHLVYSPDIVGGEVVGFLGMGIDLTGCGQCDPPSQGQRLREIDGVLMEQLTMRELHVLQLLPSHMSRKEIAAKLYVSVNTVKAHTKSIYRKLGASSRREAIEHGLAARLLHSSLAEAIFSEQYQVVVPSCPTMADRPLATRLGPTPSG
jgi:DNA-binding CsgD family transcriptional regulator